jgi:glycosyltransferase involved in cell wall biosynthesis
MNIKNNNLVSIIVPVYNESENIKEFIKEIDDCLVNNYEIIFVCDPSEGSTEDLLKKLSLESPEKIKSIIMSRRFGQHKCIIAGLKHSAGEAVVVMDVDGQDPVSIIPKMIEKWKEGYDVVYGKRLKREKITFINKITSKIGLYLVSKLSYLDIPTNVGEFRLMDKRVVEEINNFKDFSPFLRGMVSYIGFKQTNVNFIRPKRRNGETKYSKFFGSISFGVNALTTFSNKLLNLTIILGILISFLSVIIGFFYLYFKLNNLVNFPIGNPTIVISILFIGGIQLFSMGILGIYIGQITDQVKDRPQYIIDKLYGDFNLEK